MNRFSLAWLLALLLGLSSPSPAFAGSLRGRHATGTVQRVDHSSRELELGRAPDAPARALRWDRTTTFVACGRLAGAHLLVPGARVAVIYHVPIFGPPYVTKVTQLGGTCRCGPQCS